MYASGLLAVLLALAVQGTPNYRERRAPGDSRARAVEIMKQTPLIDGYVYLLTISTS